MKKRSPKLIQLLVLSALSVVTAQAQSVVTEPVGFITIPAKAGVVGVPSTTFIALSMARPVAYQSLVPSVAGQGATLVNGTTVITFPSSTFTAGQFGPGAGARPNFYLEILNGVKAGTLSAITSTATNSITLQDDLSAGITNGTTTFRIRPHWTFGTAFGTANESGFLGAATSADADLIQTVDPVTSVATSYFYNTGTIRWEKSDGTIATDIPISPEAGLQVVRKGTTDINFKLSGSIKTGPSGLYVTGTVNSPSNTFNLVGNPYALDSVLLKDAGLFTNNASTGVVGGTSGSATTTIGADIVRIFDFTHNQYNDYFYDTTSGRWKTGLVDASSTVIPAGASVAVIRKAGRSPFYWYAPQPGMVLADAPLSFALVSAASRKAQGSFGNADSNLPLTGALGVESRNAGANNTHSIVLNFTNNVSAGTASVTSGVGSVSDVSFSGKSMIVNLTGVTNAQTLTVVAANVSDSSAQTIPNSSVSFQVLSGDANGSASTTSSDVTAVKAASGTGIVTLGNHRADLNSSGVINSSDVTIAKARSGTILQ